MTIPPERVDAVRAAGTLDVLDAAEREALAGTEREFAQLLTARAFPGERVPDLAPFAFQRHEPWGFRRLYLQSDAVFSMYGVAATPVDSQRTTHTHLVEFAGATSVVTAVFVRTERDGDDAARDERRAASRGVLAYALECLEFDDGAVVTSALGNVFATIAHDLRVSTTPLSPRLDWYVDAEVRSGLRAPLFDQVARFRSRHPEVGDLRLPASRAIATALSGSDDLTRRVRDLMYARDQRRDGFDR